MNDRGIGYFLNRDWQSSARLTFQHYVMVQRLGYLIHPKIRAYIGDLETPRILDLGTGNGVWALAVARQMENAKITGLDISRQQFPAAMTLPQNLGFEQYDFFQPVPEHLRGLFDVVHIRFVVAALVRGGNADVIKHCFELLKPGGYLQWQEIIDPPLQILTPETGETSYTSPLDLVSEKYVGFVKSRQWTQKWPEAVAEAASFVDADMYVPPPNFESWNLETPLILWNSNEFGTTLANHLPSEEGKKACLAAIEETEQQAKEGKLFQLRSMVGTARRPL